MRARPQAAARRHHGRSRGTRPRRAVARARAMMRRGAAARAASNTHGAIAVSSGTNSTRIRYAKPSESVSLLRSLNPEESCQIPPPSVQNQPSVRRGTSRVGISGTVRIAPSIKASPAHRTQETLTPQTRRRSTPSIAAPQTTSASPASNQYNRCAPGTPSTPNHIPSINHGAMAQGGSASRCPHLKPANFLKSGFNRTPLMGLAPTASGYTRTPFRRNPAPRLGNPVITGFYKISASLDPG